MKCALCSNVFTEYGGLMFSPPRTDIVSTDESVATCDKYHICPKCYDKIILDLILK